MTQRPEPRTRVFPVGQGACSIVSVLLRLYSASVQAGRWKEFLKALFLFFDIHRNAVLPPLKNKNQVPVINRDVLVHIV